MATTIIAREGRGGKGEGETRAMRGLQLYRKRGSEIVFYPTTGEYGVPSRTEPDVIYHVDLERGTCECPDATCRPKVTCLHMIAAEAKRVALARKKSEAPKPATRRRCSAPPMSVRSRMAREFLARTGA